MKRFLLPALALLCLVPVSELLHARPAPPAADKKEDALKRLEQLAKELDELEQRISDERIKARKEMIEKEQRQQVLERAVTAQAQLLATEKLKLEKQFRDFLERMAPGNDANPIIVALRKKIDDLRTEQDRLAATGNQSREKLMIVEERFRLLERKHDNQRRFLNIKIELAEQELFGNRDGADRRQFEKLEQSLGTIRRDLADLQRKLASKAETKPAPSK